MEWYKKLSQREQRLALGVGLLAPIILGALLLFWFIDRYEENAAEINGLLTKISDEEEKTHQGSLAAKRQEYYRAASLPSRSSKAKNVYKSWLARLVQQTAGMSDRGVTLRDNGRLEFQGTKVGDRITFTLRPIGTLQQLQKFLHGFYAADHLHRINSLSVKPLTKPSGANKRALSGELQLVIEIEVLALADGPREMDSFPIYAKADSPIEDFDMVLNRNIFGPPNNIPTLKNPTKKKFYVGEDALVSIRASDADRDDILAFELTDWSVEGALILSQPKSARVRDTKLKIPAQEPGEYDFTVKVKDNGFPAKESELQFQITFAEKPVRQPPKVKPKDPPKPPLKMATETYVNGFMQGGDGLWKSLIMIRPMGQSLRLKEGDTFKLDKQQWKVQSVKEGSVTLEVEGEVLKFEQGSKLSEPLEDTTIKAAAAAK